MGARRLRPVVTRRTQVARLNLERLEANAIEACEQCGVVWTPEVLPLQPLETALARMAGGAPARLLRRGGAAAGPAQCARQSGP